MILTILLFILILGTIVFLHELGHFIAARRSGIAVEEFAFGFPPRLFARKRGETTYAINLIPLGGYVKLVGEDRPSKNPRGFARQNRWSRTKVVVAGVLMNFILAWVLFSIWLGLSAVLPQHNHVVVSNVGRNSVAEQLGVKGGDLLERVGETAPSTAEEAANTIKSHRGQTLPITIQRFGKQQTLQAVLPAQDLPLGVSLVDSAGGGTPIHWWQAPYWGLVYFWDIISTNAVAIGQLIKGVFTAHPSAVAGDVVGPIGIVALLSQIVSLGFLQVLRFVGVLSLAVGFFNILPFPALDGGRLLFIGIETLTGRRVNHKIESYIHIVGFVILMMIFVLITFRDIARLGH